MPADGETGSEINITSANSSKCLAIIKQPMRFEWNVK